VKLSKLFLFLVICLAAQACAKGEYGMPGLSLPPGSELVYTSVSEAPPDSPVLPNGKKAKSISMTEFNCSGGWPAVSAHFDSFMQRAGYKDSFSSMNDLFPGVGGETAVEMRMYTQDGGLYMVSVENQRGPFAAGSAPADGSGEFMLAVIEYE
jgi:hypothetical protein